MPENVQISVKEDQKIYFEDIQIQDDSTLSMLVSKKLEESEDASFIINADKTVPYEILIHVLDVVRGAGARKLALAAEKVYEESPQE